uniref:Uncharacterized protein n=1 Tax=Geospiza parvula TaxID=87175 RepID=A0A8C3Q4E7_GEOPR
LCHCPAVWSCISQRILLGFGRAGKSQPWPCWNCLLDSPSPPLTCFTSGYCYKSHLIIIFADERSILHFSVMSIRIVFIGKNIYNI